MQLEEERIDFTYMSRSPSIIEGNQGSNSSGNLEEHCLLACSPWLHGWLSLFSYNIQDYQTRSGTSQNDMSSLTSITHQKNAP